MPVKLAQQLFSTEGQVTSWVFGLHDINKMDQVTTELNLLYDDSISIRDWKDLSPELDQGIVFDRAGGLVMMYILYGIVGFGLFATLLMMTLERQREFAVMLATGMVRAKLVLLIGIESIIIGLLGTAIGAIIASPILIYYYLNPIVITGELGQQMLDMGYEPIIPVALRSDVFANQITIVLGMLLICLIYPIFRIYRLELVSALKGGSHAS
jgi:ABC-type lipoprotein release transport system permease subunit